jgi:hypothetical protein
MAWLHRHVQPPQWQRVGPRPHRAGALGNFSPTAVTFSTDLNCVAATGQAATTTTPTRLPVASTRKHGRTYTRSSSRTWRRAMLTPARQSRPSTPGRSSRACTSQTRPLDVPRLPLRALQLTPSPQGRQRHRRALKVGRDRIQGQTRVCGSVHEHPAIQHRGIRRRRQLRHIGTGPYPVQQCSLDRKGRRSQAQG